MELRRFGSVEVFLGVAEEFLVAREAEHNLILGVCNTLATAPGVYKEAPYLAAVVDGGRVVAAAIQTPPWDLVLSETDDLAAIDAVLQDRLGDHLPGVLGPSALAARFAEGWARATGTAVSVAMRERAFRLARVIAPRPTNGSMRAAGPGDRDLVLRWIIDFTDEALGGEMPADVNDLVDRWVERQGRTMQLWIDAGQPVSMTGVGSRTPNGVRIGPVYTPPDRRGRGYASNLVAAASQTELDAGRQFVFLFTDLSNPTSNHIYETIGYEPVTDVDRYRFG
jgi:uncharacterized protein